MTVRRASGRRRGNRYPLLVLGVLVVMLAVFVAIERFGPSWWQDPASWLGTAPYAAAVGVGLLIADVVLPVPSSMVMLVNGALFGAVVGSALSLAGAVGAAAAGYGLGRWAGPPLLRRVCSPAERARATELVGRWGLLAVVASRPVPLLAETVAVVAGAERLGLVRTVCGSVLGALPACVLYAVAGASGAAGPTGVLVLGAALAVTALLWAAGRAVLGGPASARRDPMPSPTAQGEPR